MLLGHCDGIVAIGSQFLRDLGVDRRFLADAQRREASGPFAAHRLRGQVQRLGSVIGTHVGSVADRRAVIHKAALAE